jgi:hypothetical protein
VGVIDKANEGTLGGGEPIFPLRIIEGDLVGNNWEVYRRGEEYIKRIGGVTEVGSRGAAEGLERRGPWNSPRCGRYLRQTIRSSRKVG